RASAEHVPNGVIEDRIGHTNYIEVNVWSIDLGKLACVDFSIPSREIFSDHEVSSLCYKGDFSGGLIFPMPCQFLAITVSPGCVAAGTPQGARELSRVDPSKLRSRLPSSPRAAHPEAYGWYRSGRAIHPRSQRRLSVRPRSPPARTAPTAL